MNASLPVSAAILISATTAQTIEAPETLEPTITLAFSYQQQLRALYLAGAACAQCKKYTGGCLRCTGLQYKLLSVEYCCF